ncbi:MAG: formylglycine-generating enzyme family protein [Lentisphaeraceae bacterium]|nr:formylglycine-generating enzyme family protein [Lentisphaeraceae bacterium]
MDSKPEKKKSIKQEKSDFTKGIKADQLKSLKKKSNELKDKLAKDQLEEKIKLSTKSPTRIITLGVGSIILILTTISFFKNKAHEISGGIDPTTVPRFIAKGELVEVPDINEFPIDLNPVLETYYPSIEANEHIGDGPIQAIQNQKETSKEFKLPVEISDEYGMNFRLIPPGEFLMGSPSSDDRHDDVEYQHLSTIPTPFYVGKHEVTVGQWESVMGNLPYNSTKVKTNPVTGVSLNDCLTFVQMLNRKLKKDAGYRYFVISENEWEYACRAGSEKTYSFGPRIVIDDYAVYRSSTTTHNVEKIGSKLPNAYGLHDMHGNAMEWTRTPFFIYACGPNQYAGISTREAKAADISIKEGSWDIPIYDGEHPENLIHALDKFEVPTRTVGANLDICYHDRNGNKEYDKHEPIWKDHLSQGTLNVYDPDIDTDIVTFAKKIPTGTKGEKETLFYHDKNVNTEWNPGEELWARNNSARKHVNYYVLRGGAFYFTEEECRSAYRARAERQNAPTYAGLRIVIYLNKFIKNN